MPSCLATTPVVHAPFALRSMPMVIICFTLRQWRVLGLPLAWKLPTRCLSNAEPERNVSWHVLQVVICVPRELCGHILLARCHLCLDPPHVIGAMHLEAEAVNAPAAD